MPSVSTPPKPIPAVRAKPQGSKPGTPKAQMPKVDPKAAAGRERSPQDKAKPEAAILFQTYFKSVGPRTYAAQLKEAGNGNHFLVFTEGKRDEKTGDVRKTKLYVFSEDFRAFFKMLHETAVFIRENPVSEEVKRKRERFWAKHNGAAGSSAKGNRVNTRPGGSAVHQPSAGAAR